MSQVVPLTLRRAMDDVAADVDRVFDRLLALPGDSRDRLYAAMRHAAIGGGKRLRPLLVRAAADLFHVDPDRALQAGVAVECVHVYSLIHDDMPCMDDDDMRRGKPTVHREYDEATAVLAGDSLYGLAFEVLSSPDCHPDPFVRAGPLARASSPARAARRAWPAAR